MKTKLAFVSLCCMLICMSAFAQQNTTEPRVSITKSMIEPDGSQRQETIEKKGQAALDFNIDQYVADNKGDNVSLDIRSTGGVEDRHVVVKGRNAPNNKIRTFEREVRETLNDTWEWTSKSIEDLTDDVDYDYTDDSAFLGVMPDSDEDGDEDGLVVEIVSGSPARSAGLRNNDIILQLNGQKINRWDDLSKFMRTTKVGDKVVVMYRRNGKEATTEAILKTRDDRTEEPCCTPKGFLGVSPIGDDDENKPGVAVSITKNSAAEKIGMQKNDVLIQLNDTPIRDFEDVSDFMANTKPNDVLQVTYERNGQRNTVATTLTEEKSWDWEDMGVANITWDINERTKEACLGVYTTDGRDGAQISAFTEKSAAKKADLDENDIIVSIDGEPITGESKLWDVVSKYKSGEKVKVTYLRNGKTNVKEIELRPCEDTSSKIQISSTDAEGNGRERQITTWNWGSEDRKQLEERRTITIHKNSEGDNPVINAAPKNNAASNRKLELKSYKSVPGTSAGQITIEFTSEQVSTTVSLFDASGRELFQEEMNAFDGSYKQQFDMSEFAKGTIQIQIQQGEKIFSDQINVN